MLECAVCSPQNDDDIKRIDDLFVWRGDENKWVGSESGGGQGRGVVEECWLPTGITQFLPLLHLLYPDP
jgi:hypothetical protein